MQGMEKNFLIHIIEVAIRSKHQSDPLIGERGTTGLDMEGAEKRAMLSHHLQTCLNLIMHIREDSQGNISALDEGITGPYPSIALVHGSDQEDGISFQSLHKQGKIILDGSQIGRMDDATLFKQIEGILAMHGRIARENCP